MTIAIGALCNSGKAVIVASDRMITGRYPPIEFEHNVSKVEPLGPSCVTATAGNALAHIEVFRSVRAKLYQLQAPPISAIVDGIKDAYQRERRRRTEEQILGPRGVTVEEFYQDYVRRWPPEVAVAIDRDIMQNEYGLDIIVAGVDDSGAHLYAIDDPGVSSCFDSFGYHAIGSGMTHAVVALTSGRVVPFTPLRQVLYYVYAAKRAAEAAPGVGDATDIVVVHQETGTPTVEPVQPEDMEVLRSAYEEQMQPKTENLTQALSALNIGGKAVQSGKNAEG
jgi:20S proteasome alpha/beta subunit